MSRTGTFPAFFRRGFAQVSLERRFETFLAALRYKALPPETTMRLRTRAERHDLFHSVKQLIKTPTIKYNPFKFWFLCVTAAH